MDTLYHANTVTTSCSLVRSGVLLSRADLIAAHMLQTNQYTDDLDQEVGIFSDVFLDTVDIHACLRRHNNYGPVLFSFPLAFLRRAGGPGVSVTRSNPADWTTATPNEERWFCDFESLNRDFTRGNFAQIIVLRTPGASLRFEAHLTRVVLDDPQLVLGGADCFTTAQTALLQAAQEGGLNLQIAKRNCDQACDCREAFASNPRLVFKFFNPNVGG